MDIFNTPRRAYQTNNQQTFILQSPWSLERELGQGAYGFVVSARNPQTQEKCAVKKVTNIFTKKILTKRCLRELRLLAHFRGHKNITCLYDMDIVLDPPGSDNFHEVYLYEELMEADLNTIIRSGQPLSDAHFQSFIYQTLCGLKYIHSANVLHRDLKPGNLLVNANCDLKICDFGLARGFEQGNADDGQAGIMTEYVATRWYRAPEIMLSNANYTSAIDLWSVGCILAELIGGKPIFRGEDYLDQLTKILKIVGTPSDRILERVATHKAHKYIQTQLPYYPPVAFQTLYPRANPDALDLLDKLLAFDPAARISCQGALDHPYLDIWREDVEHVCEVPFDFSFEKEEDIGAMRKLILDEVSVFRQLTRLHQAPSGAPAVPLDMAAASGGGAGLGPGFAPEAVNHADDRAEDPHAALERQMAEGKK